MQTVNFTHLTGGAVGTVVVGDLTSASRNASEAARTNRGR
jgi:hypothetical protein